VQFSEAESKAVLAAYGIPVVETRIAETEEDAVAAAAAIGWRELMAAKASYFDFSTDGQSFSRSQWFKHCELMANHYDGLAKPMSFAPSALTRTDICP